jgi:hypothetical protein
MPSPVHPYSEYGVALRTLKSSQTWLALGLVFCVVVQILGFFLMWATSQPYAGSQAKYEKTNYEQLKIKWQPPVGPTTHGATNPAEPEFFAGTVEGKKLNIRPQWEAVYSAGVAITQIMSLMAVCSQVIIIFLTLLLILVAQAPGVVHVTRGLIWSILLLCMVLPWQYVASNFPFPGVFYGYKDLLELIGPHVDVNQEQKVFVYQKLLVYARFIVWPLVSMFVLLIVYERFRAGIMLAVGHPLQSMMQNRTGASPAQTTAGTPARKIGL